MSLENKEAMKIIIPGILNQFDEMQKNDANEIIQEMLDKSIIWKQAGNALYLESKNPEFPTLENAVYKLGYNQMRGFYVSKVSDSFTFNYKLYGLETKLVKRVQKTYETTMNVGGNLGVLLNGVKGTGKTVTAKLIANTLKQPVIVVDMKDCHEFLNRIPQNITIFIDEYEKVFEKSSEMLTIMDGALNSRHRRVFILTTNNLFIEENLIQRPGRIRYLKKFSHLAPEIVEEVIDDLLQYKKHKPALIKFISQLDVITVDIVKSIIMEVNIHNESPESFGDVFNVSKLKGKFNVFVKGDDGEFKHKQYDNISLSPRPDFNDNIIGNWVTMDDTTIGKVTKVISWNVIEIAHVRGHCKLPAWLKKLGNKCTIKIDQNYGMNYNYSYGKGKNPNVHLDDEYDF